MFRVGQAHDRDALSALGFPVELTHTGGEPLAHEIEAQKRAIATWNDILRLGDSLLLRRIAAVANRETGAGYAEDGYSALYLDEVDAALMPQDEEDEEDAD
jgi:hypothetical protein